MTFLEEILELKKQRVETAKAKGKRQEAKIERPSHMLRTALSDADKIHIIAEIKRASPSKGIINDKIDKNLAMRKFKLIAEGKK